MSLRSDVSPSTLGVEVGADGITVEYLDGRRVTYGAPRERVEGGVRCAPGREVHVLVTAPSEERGVVVYVNDRRTHEDVLETTGVGRVLLEPGEETTVFPGVTARADGHAVEVETDPSAVDGRVFVFEEDEFGERAYEIVGG